MPNNSNKASFAFRGVVDMRKNVNAQRPNGQYLGRMDRLSAITRQATTHEGHAERNHMSRRTPVLLLAVALPTARSTPTRPPMASSDFLYVWASSADSSGPDFLAVYDVRERVRVGAVVHL